MLGLFGTLNLGARSLQIQRQGVEVAGHNLANVNNPAYARQRINIQTSLAIPSALGSQGTGADVISIQQLRSSLLDAQIQTEGSVSGFLEAKQKALQNGQAVLGEQIDQQGGGEHGIAAGLSTLFSAFQSLSTNSTSLSERQNVVMQGQNLASQLRQIDGRLGRLSAALDDAVEGDVSTANDLIKTIANYNSQIFKEETDVPGSANDLRDLRQQKIEELSKLVNLQTAPQAGGMVTVSISGVTVVADAGVADTLETYDAGGGQMLVRARTAGTPLALTGGSLQGTIDARDGALQDLRSGVNGLAALLITEVNALHSSGFGLSGTTGENFFTGTNAADIDVNSALEGNPALLQASGTNGAVGDNQVALALAQLANKAQASLSNQTFSENHGQSVAGLGNALSSVNRELNDQTVVGNMLLRQRDSVSGVSLDEEMTDLVKFQKAFQASAHLITTIDEMLDTVLSLKR